MRKRKMIKLREITEQEKSIIKEIKKQKIASYELSRNYTFLKWYDKNGKVLGDLWNPTHFVAEAVIEQWKKSKDSEVEK